MGTFWQDMRHALFMGMVVPMLLVPTMLRFTGVRSQGPEFTAPAETWDSGQQVELTDGETENLESYLTGVLLGEIPASFPDEALRAQAVAARTYTKKATRSGGKHGGKICRDAACCQAYCSVEDYLARGGSQENLSRVRQAVRQTDGLVLTYDGNYIEATYFSCSGGRTEDAVDVWGVDYPYLSSTDSPGEEESNYYRSTAFFTRQELEEALSVELSSNSRDWLGEITWTEGGGVRVMTLAGTSFAGTELRQKLRLPSAAFTVYPEGDGLRFETRGYGHRVGMSQYGAQAMAQSGASFREILAHYYCGAELVLDAAGKIVEK